MYVNVTINESNTGENNTGENNNTNAPESSYFEHKLQKGTALN